MSGDITHDDPPSLDLGSFHFGAVTHGTRSHQVPATEPNPSLGVLSFLQNKVFKGKGFNTIFRPRSNKPLNGVPVPGPASDNDLELNLTQETLTFSKPIGSIPNRGLGEQPDIALGGIMYVQSVQDVTNTKTGKADGKPIDIHIEPGVWMNIPSAAASAVDVPTLCRMGSIPHGTTINAQGGQPDLSGIGGPPPIPAVNITPFVVGQPENLQHFASQELSGKDNRVPQDLDLFDANGTITQDILNDPATILRNDLKNKTILKTITWNVNTVGSSSIDGGGTANIAFLGGPGATASSEGSKPNAFGHSMEATFWLETVQHTFSVPGGVDAPQTHRPSGDFGPTFIVPSTKGRTSAVTITTTYLQLQYLQQVILNFSGLSWPHVSVATLAETTTIHLALPPVKTA